VRAERERLELTQAELAERMATTQPTVARLEAGGVTPSLDTLHRAAAGLGLELVVDFRQPASA
jgi:transcriptional regulator with XRE-family HTH domain